MKFIFFIIILIYFSNADKPYPIEKVFEILVKDYLSELESFDNQTWQEFEIRYKQPKYWGEIYFKDLEDFFWLNYFEKKVIIEVSQKKLPIETLLNESILSLEKYNLLLCFISTPKKKQENIQKSISKNSLKLNFDLTSRAFEKDKFSNIHSFNSFYSAIDGKIIFGNVFNHSLTASFFLLAKKRYFQNLLNRTAFEFNLNNSSFKLNFFLSSFKTKLSQSLLFSTRYAPFVNVYHFEFYRNKTTTLKIGNNKNAFLPNGIGISSESLLFDKVIFFIGKINYSTKVITNDFFYPDLKYLSSFPSVSSIETNFIDNLQEKSINKVEVNLMATHIDNFLFFMKNKNRIGVNFFYFSTPFPIINKSFYGKDLLGFSLDYDFKDKIENNIFNFSGEISSIYRQDFQNIYDPKNQKKSFAFAMVNHFSLLFEKSSFGFRWHVLATNYNNPYNRTFSQRGKDENGFLFQWKNKWTDFFKTWMLFNSSYRLSNFKDTTYTAHIAGQIQFSKSLKLDLLSQIQDKKIPKFFFIKNKFTLFLKLNKNLSIIETFYWQFFLEDKKNYILRNNIRYKINKQFYLSLQHYFILHLQSKFYYLLFYDSKDIQFYSVNHQANIFFIRSEVEIFNLSLGASYGVTIPFIENEKDKKNEILVLFISGKI